MLNGSNKAEMIERHKILLKYDVTLVLFIVFEFVKKKPEALRMAERQRITCSLSTMYFWHGALRS